MKTLLTIFVLFGICLSFENIYGAEQTIHISYLNRLHLRIVSRTEVGVLQLSGECIKKTSESMDCSFARTLIKDHCTQRLPSDEELREEIKKYVNYDEISKQCKEILAEKGNIEKQPRESKSDTPLTKKQNKQYRRWLTVCENPSEERVLVFFKEDIEENMGTCTCTVSTYVNHSPLHFKKIGPYKWMSIQGPSGPCKEFVTYTIEDDDPGWSNWTYTEVSFYTSQDKHCSERKSPEPKTLRHHYSIEMECSSVSFF